MRNGCLFDIDNGGCDCLDLSLRFQASRISLACEAETGLVQYLTAAPHQPHLILCMPVRLLSVLGMDYMYQSIHHHDYGSLELR